MVFRANTFRLTEGLQYADELWLRSMGAVATPATAGRVDAVRAAFLPDGDAAQPAELGALSWQADANPSQGDAHCVINVFDADQGVAVPAMNVTPKGVSVAGALEFNTATGAPWRLAVDATGNLLMIQKLVNGNYQTKSLVSHS
jgi:hypothetical protein